MSAGSSGASSDGWGAVGSGSGRTRGAWWTWSWIGSRARGGVALSDMSAEATPIELDDDKFHDECGLFGIWNHAEAANVVYLGLYALQHRGQESAGIASTDGEHFQVEKAMGWGAAAFRRDRGQLHPPQRPAPHRHHRARTRGHRPQRQSGQRRGAARGAGEGRRGVP